MINKIHIFALAFILVFTPLVINAASENTLPGKATSIVESDVLSEEKSTADSSCRHVDDSDCCKHDYGCCLAHAFPTSGIMDFTNHFTQPENTFKPAGLENPHTDRLIRPPRYS